MNMVSESDLPRPVSGPVLNVPAGPGATGRADLEERLEWRQKVNIFKTTYSFIATTDSADERSDA